MRYLSSRPLPVQALTAAILAFAASLIAGMSFFVQPNLANAATGQCQSHGVAEDAVSGAGVTITVTTTGACNSAPLTLASIDDTGIATILDTVPQTQTATGTVASITFVPDTATQYQVTIDGVFNATVTE